MGQGGSKAGAEGERLPARLFPLLSRRYEEIRRYAKMRPSTKGASPSKSGDRNGTEQGDDSEPHCANLERINVKEDNAGHLVKANAEPTAASLVIKEFKEMLQSPEEAAENKEPSHEEERNTEKKDNEEQKGGGGGGEKLMGNEEDEYFFPGSPSFRVYCVNSLANDKNDGHDDGKFEGSDSIDGYDGTETSDDRSQTDESHETDTSKDSREGSETKRVKKQKRGRKLRRAITKGRPAGVMNLLNVRSCYHPPCSSHDRTLLLSKKAVA